MTLIVNYKTLNVPDPVAVAVDALGPQWAWFAKLVKAGAIVGLTSVVLVLMYGQTRIFYTMARDGLLPRVFATIHPKFKTPWVNTILVGLITAVAAAFFDINTLGDMTSVGTLAAFAIVCLSVIWLRRTHPEIPRGFRVPLFPVLPALGIVACIALIFTVETRVLVFFGWYTLVAIVLYFVYGMRNSRLYHGLDEADGPDDGRICRAGRPEQHGYADDTRTQEEAGGSESRAAESSRRSREASASRARAFRSAIGRAPYMADALRRADRAEPQRLRRAPCPSPAPCRKPGREQVARAGGVDHPLDRLGRDRRCARRPASPSRRRAAA